MISTDVMISATATRLPPPASHLPVPGACNSASLWIEHQGAYMGAYSQVRLGVSCLLRVYLGACSGVYLRTYSEVYLGGYSEFTWKRLESLLGSV